MSNTQSRYDLKFTIIAVLLVAILICLLYETRKPKPEPMKFNEDAARKLLDNMSK